MKVAFHFLIIPFGTEKSSLHFIVVTSGSSCPMDYTHIWDKILIAGIF